MGCTGCAFSVGFYPATSPPFWWAMAGFQPAGDWPDGKCVEKAGKCDPDPCHPIGNVIVISNVVQRPIRVHDYLGHDYTIQNFGEGMVIPGVDVTVPCGSEFIAADIYDDGQDPPTLLGKVKLVCSECCYST